MPQALDRFRWQKYNYENKLYGMATWHGAAADSRFSHLAIEVEGRDSNERLEPVPDEQYYTL